MAQSNMFCEGNIVRYNGKLAKIMKNSCHDFRYWQIDMYNSFPFVHFRDLEYVIDNANNYKDATGKEWYAEYLGD